MVKKTKAVTVRRRVTFEIEANIGSKVAIAGCFNEWDDSKKMLTDKDGNGVFKCTMILAPGSYEYKFVVDGAWTLDPNNPNFIPNNHGTLNSLLKVG